MAHENFYDEDICLKKLKTQVEESRENEGVSIVSQPMSTAEYINKLAQLDNQRRSSFEKVLKLYAKMLEKGDTRH